MSERAERIQFAEDFCSTRTSTLNCVNCRSSLNLIEKHPASFSSVPLTVEHAMPSVCLITLNNGVWASGVLLNEQGLILTNAHLLEPWRFGRTPIHSGFDETRIKNTFFLLEDSMPLRHAGEKKNTVVQSNSLHPLNYQHKNHGLNPNHQVHSEISVRIDLMNSWLWCNAKVVYISKGPLDISLLQLESVPNQLRPIHVDLPCPSPGSKAFVIGHGLLGPRCGKSIYCFFACFVIHLEMHGVFSIGFSYVILCATNIQLFVYQIRSFPHLLNQIANCRN